MPLVAKEVVAGTIAIIVTVMELRRMRRKAIDRPRGLGTGCIEADHRNLGFGCCLFGISFVVEACPRIVEVTNRNLPWLFHTAIVVIVVAFHLGCS